MSTSSSPRTDPAGAGVLRLDDLVGVAIPIELSDFSALPEPTAGRRPTRGTGQLKAAAMTSWSQAVHRRKELECVRDELLAAGEDPKADSIRELDMFIRLEQELIDRLLWVASGPAELQ